MTIECGVSYPGLINVTGHASGTLTSGTHPSIFTIETAVNPTMPDAIGRLSFTENGQEVVGFRDCAVDGIFRSSVEADTFTVKILDRRWKWHAGGGVISGHYNKRKPDKTIWGESQKSPQELFEMLFERLDEVVDLSLVPPVFHPNISMEVKWDHIRPVQAIEELASRLGLRIVLGTDDRVKLWPVGVGAQLPQWPDRMCEIQESVESTAVPDGVIVYAAPTIWQGLLKLEAVGLDLDNSIKPIDELSYKPGIGWNMWCPSAVENGVDFGKDQKEKDRSKQLAKQTIYRWYRVVGQPDGSLGPIPHANFDVKSRNQYQLLSELIETKDDNSDGYTKVEPFVVGQWAIDGSLSSYVTGIDGNSKENLRYGEPISIDQKNSIVVFPQVMTMYHSQHNFVPASLFVYAAYQLKHPLHGMPVRYTRETTFPVPQRGTGLHPINVNDLSMTVRLTHPYVALGIYGEPEIETNEQEMQQASDYYTLAKQRELLPDPGQDASYGGFLNICPDGAIVQVSWTWSDGIGKTRASRNTEHSLLAPRYKQRLQLSRVETIAEKLKTLEDRGE
ncbi:hypothetical protein SH668x_001279 [Planctomicrobium sp. SH668]|uniref:hypothetical protein n=1 Tax=Planctomicrobium sp. SH668 TaxID=3448126 RepID=UPI003F5BE9F2